MNLYSIEAIDVDARMRENPFRISLLLILFFVKGLIFQLTQARNGAMALKHPSKRMLFRREKRVLVHVNSQ